MKLTHRKYRVYVEIYSDGEIRFYPQRRIILFNLIKFWWTNYTTGDEYFDWDVYFSTKEQAINYINQQSKKVILTDTQIHKIN